MTAKLVAETARRDALIKLYKLDFKGAPDDDASKVTQWRLQTGAVRFAGPNSSVVLNDRREEFDKNVTKFDTASAAIFNLKRDLELQKDVMEKIEAKVVNANARITNANKELSAMRAMPEEREAASKGLFKPVASAPVAAKPAGPAKPAQKTLIMKNGSSLNVWTYMIAGEEVLYKDADGGTHTIRTADVLVFPKN